MLCFLAVAMLLVMTIMDVRLVYLYEGITSALQRLNLIIKTICVCSIASFLVSLFIIDGNYKLSILALFFTFVSGTVMMVMNKKRDSIVMQAQRK